MDDIPEALREQTRPKKSFSPKKPSRLKPQASRLRLLAILVPIAAIAAVILGMAVSFLFRPSTTQSTPEAEINNDREQLEKYTKNPLLSQPNDSKTETPDSSSPTVSSTPEENVSSVLGHLKYTEAPISELKAIVADGSIKMRAVAANKFLQMQVDARKEGINIYPISGFRNVSQQNELFFKVKEQRGQDVNKRAEVSAPPGYSEHHTGYAVDIGDADAPSTNLNTSFEKTAAFRWLKANASRYSFEISFPEGNLQGISYEPWHWRFVGDIHSLETFYNAKNLKQPLSK
jgi:zinc D-Ala-D-Ala carboxypeptidase